jgi:hypothetical protein
LAFTVRVTGPEFTSEENQRAFLRIEESARQYSAHSRESIYLIRRPLEMPEDHFVLLWPRGAAIIGMYPYGGSIHGENRGEWESEPTSTPIEPRRISMRSRPEHLHTTFASPYSTLEPARNELSTLLNLASKEDEPLEVESSQAKTREKVASHIASNGRPVATTMPIALIGLFTGPVEQIRIGHIEDALFSAMSLEDAVARSIVHTPNLLRAADMPGVSYSNDELERFCLQLERSAKWHERNRTPLEQLAATAPSARLTLPRPKTHRWKRSPKLLVPLVIILAVVGIYVVRSLLRPAPQPPVPASQQVATRAPSEIVIKMPIEAELFISSAMFQTREELDHALTYGEGERFLPDTEEQVIMDSVSLARGVYGYFKVDNTWRKGKLLQTLQPVDTISIVKFLDPLP